MSSMLELIKTHRALVESRARELFLALPVAKPTITDLEDGIAILIDQLVETLRRGDRASETEIERIATQYGCRLFTRGFTVGELVRGYGSICEAVTKVGQELNVRFSNREFEMLNRVLDVAIAAAVTEYQRQRVDATAYEELQHLGSLAHELRNALAATVMSFSMIKQGVVGTGGRTSDALERSLKRMGDLLDRALAEVRLRKDAVPRVEPLRVAEVFEEIAWMVYPDTEARSQRLEIEVDHDLEIATDRQLFTSAVSNLVQNGVKYTPTGGHIGVRARSVDDRLVIEVEDECGGLSMGTADHLFAPFVRGTTHTPGTGLGLSIVARASRTLGGDVQVRNRPGKGCVFTIDLPSVPVTTTAA
jgi:signal transduction histidine kinase